MAVLPHRPGLCGVLVIDKAAGMTSFDVVARARQALSERRIGHAGTLISAILLLFRPRGIFGREG